MYGDQPLNFTLIAAVATGQYLCVLGSGENYGGQAVSKTQVVMGISQNSAGVGEHISVCPIGESRCWVNSAVTAYANVSATAGGGITVSASGDQVIGKAMEAGAIGDLIRVFVQPSYQAAT